MTDQDLREYPQGEHWSVFDTYILGKWQVCDNCFKLTHEIYAEYEKEELKKSLRGVLKSRAGQTKYSETDYRPSYSVSGSKKTICQNCGGERNWALNSLPKDIVLDYGENLYNRLTEIPGIRVDKSEFMDTLHEYKSDQDLQNKDGYIFHKTVENSVNVNHEKLP